jgi:hypothetical protein
MRQPRRQRRADRNRNRENRQEHGDDRFGAADIDGDERRQQRQNQRADEPEPAHYDRAPPKAWINAKLFDERTGRQQYVAVDGEFGRAFACLRDGPACDPARQRGEDHQPGKMDRVAVAARGKASGDGTDQDGEEGTALDQRITRRQFCPAEMIRQDAVFDRAE